MAPYREISPAEAYAARSKVRLIDVREPAELTGELGKLPGVENVPLGTLAEASKTWDRNADIILICRSGGRSTAAAQQLVRAGFGNVANMTGGMLAYNAAALPLTR